MIYEFKHPSREQYIEVNQGINEKHEYLDKNGLKWNRVFGGNQIGISTKIDPFSSRQFVEKTGNQRGNVGDLIDRSAELSEKRAQKAGGTDPLKQKLFDDYKSTRGGKIHPKDPSRFQSLKDRASKAGISVTF